MDDFIVKYFNEVAKRVPAYAKILKEAGILAESVVSLQDFARLPILGKRETFQRFEIAELCFDGRFDRLGSVLTSSGHSGVFAFGLNEAKALPDTVKWVDDSLDLLFAVKSRPTLLINCLPMGVKISTEACTLAEISVRPDMAVGVIEAFARHFAQIIFVGDTAFIKSVLELGMRRGVRWRSYLIHVIVGEELLAENARSYLEKILEFDRERPEEGMVFSSMGVAEVGLNLFFEVPPRAPLIALRRLLHTNRDLRRLIVGEEDWVPSIFTYDPRRIFVEFDAAGRLVLTTLDWNVRLPLVRYATGDYGCRLSLPLSARPALEAAGIEWELINSIPIVMISGRREHALAGSSAVYPEAVKEGIYHDEFLAALTTANFRLVSGPARVLVRIQLSPGVEVEPQLNLDFAKAIAHYVREPIEVVCENYAAFGSGMTLDYERKFNYLDR